MEAVTAESFRIKTAVFSGKNRKRTGVVKPIVKTTIAGVLSLVWSHAACAYTEIAGDLPRDIGVDKSPYLVVADIFVPEGKTVSIAPGAVFLFNNFTGLHVRGILTAVGTTAHPIVFTSSNDREYSPSAPLNPTPYDWNGIYIQKDGMGTQMEHFSVRYSVKGIVSETKFINLSSGSFRENGRSHCTIEGVEQAIAANGEFSHSVSIKDATVDGVPARILEDPLAPKRNAVRFGGLTCMAGGLAIGGLSGLSYREARSDFEALKSRDTSNTINHRVREWESARLKRDRSRFGTFLGAVIAVLGSFGFVWSYTF